MQRSVSDIDYLAYCVNYRVHNLSQFIIKNDNGIELNRKDMIEHIIEKTIEILEERANNGKEKVTK